MYLWRPQQTQAGCRAGDELRGRGDAQPDAAEQRGSAAGPCPGEAGPVRQHEQVLLALEQQPPPRRLFRLHRQRRQQDAECREQPEQPQAHDGAQDREADARQEDGPSDGPRLQSADQWGEGIYVLGVAGRIAQPVIRNWK